MAEIKLKPCPFCGGKAGIAKSNDGAMIMCKEAECHCVLDTWFPSEEEAIEAWNTRHREAFVTVNQYGGECTQIGSVKNLTIGNFSGKGGWVD